MIRVRRSYLPVLGLALLPAMCRLRAAQPVVADDDGGESVRLAEPARRIVSLNPTVTEILFAIGAGDRVVGRTKWCDWPPTALKVASVGEGFPPNVEAVLARRPDLAVAYSTGVNEPALAQLRALGVPVLAFRTDRLEDLARAARVLGRVTGQARAGDSLATVLERVVTNSAQPGHAKSPGPTVVILAWDAPPIAIGRGSYLHQIVELAGGRNLFGEVRQASVPVSLEAIAARDPDALLVVGDMAATLPHRSEWQVVRAVREGRVLLLNDPAVVRPSLRALAAIAPLRARLRRLVSSSSLEIAR